jgi:hypothetical protein
MNRPPFIVVIVLSGMLSSLATAASFTPEQIAEIRALVREELRAETEAEVRAELEHEYLAKDSATASAPQAEAETAVVADAAEAINLPAYDPTYRSAPLTLASERFLATAAAAPMEHTGTSARSGFQLSAGTDTQRASIRLGRERSFQSGEGLAVFDSVALTVSAPLSKPDTGITNLATLDGFANASELALTYSRWSVEGLRNPARVGPERMAQRDKICASAGIKDGEPCDFPAVKEGLKKAGHDEYYPAYRALFWDLADAKRWTYGGTLRVGHEAYDYFGPDLAKTNDTELPWGAKAYVGFMPRGTEVFVAIGAEWQQSHQAVPPQTACTNASTPILSCVTGSLSAPRSKIKHLLTTEARGELAGVGLALKMTHDFKNDESGVDLPIYLFRNEGGQFSGGIRAGWTSTDDLSFGVFVGTPFTITR